MTNLVPIPAPIPMPPPFVVPDAELALPSFTVPPWEPVPIYRDDVPALNPQTAGEGEEPEEGKETDKPTEQQPQAPTPEMPPLPETELPPLPDVPQMNTVELPGGFEVPVPPQEILVTAVTTAGTAAVVSVGATMAATNLFKRIVSIAKPLIKTVLKKLAKLTGKKPPQTWGRERLLVSHQRRQGKKRYRDES